MNRLNNPSLSGSSPYVVYVYVSTFTSFIVILFVVLIVLFIGGIVLLVAALAISKFGAGSPVLVVTSSNNDENINRRPALINKNEAFISQCIVLNFPEPGAQSVTVYQTSCHNLSTHFINSLEEMTFPIFTPLKGERGGYNYFVQRDVSINLGPDSYLKYVVNATSTSSDPGCLRLCLIDSEQVYKDFKGNKNTTIVPCSECVNVGNATNEATTEIIFNITVQGDYYVAYDSPGSISITSAIFGIQTYYSVTGLAESCLNPLSSTNPTCTLCLCKAHSPGFCFDLNTEPVCLLAQTSGSRQESNTNITYQVQNNSFAGKSAYIFSSFLLYIFISTIVVVICVLVIIALYKRWH